MEMTKELKQIGQFKILFWTDGGMQNGYFIEDTSDGTQSYLFCDSEGAEYIEHILQLGYGDAFGECEDVMERHRWLSSMLKP
jgi:hypothetical protein